MRLVSRSGLIAIALAVGAVAAPASQASSLAGISSAPAARSPVMLPIPAQQVSAPVVTPNLDKQGSAWVVKPNPDEQASAATLSGATPGQATSSRDGVGEPRLRAQLAQLARTRVDKIKSTTAPEVSGSSGPQGFHLGDAAIGAGVMVGLMLLGAAGALAARRRGRPLHP